jgi:hypothetical protein
MNKNDITTIINRIQKEEKEILWDILNKLLSKSIKSKEKELIKNIITSFFELNKRFESIKATCSILDTQKQQRIGEILDKYYESIENLKIKVNSL